MGLCRNVTAVAARLVDWTMLSHPIELFWLHRYDDPQEPRVLSLSVISTER
jgi:hypothetical protein